MNVVINLLWPFAQFKNTFKPRMYAISLDQFQMIVEMVL